MQKFRVCQTRVAQVARTAARKGKNLEVRLSMGAKHVVRGKIQSAPEPGSTTRLLELWWQLVAASRESQQTSSKLPPHCWPSLLCPCPMLAGAASSRVLIKLTPAYNGPATLNG